MKAKGKGAEVKAVVHTSLPPLVEGTEKGCVSVCVKGPVQWKCRVRPPAPRLSIRLKWWGEKTQGTLFRIPVAVHQLDTPQGLGTGPNCSFYAIRAGLSQFRAYLKDMGPLVLEVGLGHMTDPSMVIGKATIPDLTPLGAKGHIKGRYSIVSSRDVVLGEMVVVLELHLHTVQGNEVCTHKGSPAAEFVVGPGATNKHRPGQSATLRADLSKLKVINPWQKWCEVGQVVGGVRVEKEGGSAVGRVEKEKEDRSPVGRVEKEKEDRSPVGRVEKEKEDRSPVGRVEKGGSSAADKRGTHIGRHQMELISELLEKGSKLRDKMIGSLTAGIQPLKAEDVPKDPSRPAGLVLMSAELDDLSSESTTFTYELSDDESSLNVASPRVTSHVTMAGPRVTSHVTTAGPLVTSHVTTAGPHVTSHVTTAGPRVTSHVTTAGPHVTSHVATAGPRVTSHVTTADPRVTSHVTTAGPCVTSHVTTAGPRVTSPALGDDGDTDDHEVRGRVTAVTSLSSLFGQSAVAQECEIAKSVGLEQLTRLARASSVRVLVGGLHIHPSATPLILQHKKRKKEGPVLAKDVWETMSAKEAALRATYFVEYQFPAVLLDVKTSGRGHHHVYEVMRIACKKMENGKVTFNHRSVFPVLLNSKVLQSWWNSSLIFRVYCRPQNVRMPRLVGKAVVSLRPWLTSFSLHSELSLPVHSSSLSQGPDLNAPCNTPCIGELKVSIEMLSGRDPYPHPGPVDAVSAPVSAPEAAPMSTTEPLKSKLKEAEPTLPDVPVLQLVLLIPEGVDIKLDGNLGPLPNCYLVCKLFSGQPYPKTPVEWKTANPQFLFRQLFPLHQSATLIKKFCNNFSVVEVWHRAPGDGTDDQLVGLVKLSLHQFFLGFYESSSARMSIQAELPLVAVDSWCPIVDPISGRMCGHLAVLLALGTPDQVSFLLSQHAAGCFPIRPRYQGRVKCGTCEGGTCEGGTCEGGTCERGVELRSVPGHQPALTHHQFTVQVEGIRDLEMASTTVWGEADCFIQYHFPALTDDSDTELSLVPCRTPTSLYMPNPCFSHVTRHSILLATERPIGQAFVQACGHPLNPHIPFELWRRFYFPNIRDQLLAKASIPVVKLSALVGMHNGCTSRSQAFPLTLKTFSGNSKEGCGVLDVVISYQACSQHTTERKRAEPCAHIGLSLGVLRLAGLKRAATLAAQDHPFPLDFAVEVGVNSYVKISTMILPEPHVTKTMPKSFAPELSDFIEVAVPFPQGEETRCEVLASELVQSSLQVEVWHQVPKNVVVGDSDGSGKVKSAVVGRRLAPSFQDVLLGVAYVPLKGLLTHTGVHGWYPLLQPATSHQPPVSGPTLHAMPHQGVPMVTCAYVGGVEVSATFTTKRDRQLVLTSAKKAGLEPPQLLDRLEMGGAKYVEVRLEISSLWLEDVHTSQAVSSHTPSSHQQGTYCFVRYRFFDLDAVTSTPRLASLSREGEGLSHYWLQHRALLSLPSSLQLQWYLSEERCEVQVWASKTAHSVRPVAGDVLVGSVYIQLSQLLSPGGTISGWYPIFKSGADDLGRQAVYMHLSMVPSEGVGSLCGVQVLDSVLEETTPPAPVSTSSEDTSSDQVEGLEGVTFEACVMIHEALHLPLLKDMCLPNPYVTLHPHPSVDKISTAVVTRSDNPTWQHQCATHLPTLHLQPQSPGVELQVWSHSDDGQDQHIGCVTVDLSTLVFGFPQVTGWYHIVDFAGDVQGQLKVSVIPKERKNFTLLHSHLPSHPQLRLLCPPSTSVISTNSTSTSFLFQQLRENIKDLDHIHQSLQAKLAGAESQRCGQHVPGQGNSSPSATPPRQHHECSPSATPQRQHHECSPSATPQRQRSPSATPQRQHSPSATPPRQHSPSATPPRQHSPSATPPRQHSPSATPPRKRSPSATPPRQHSPSATPPRQRSPSATPPRQHSPSATPPRKRSPSATPPRQRSPSSTPLRQHSPSATPPRQHSQSATPPRQHDKCSPSTTPLKQHDDYSPSTTPPRQHHECRLSATPQDGGHGSQGTGNGSQGSGGNGSQGTGNGSQGTGNGSQGTGNESQGTGHGSRGTGNGSQDMRSQDNGNTHYGSGDNLDNTSNALPTGMTRLTIIDATRSAVLDFPEPHLPNYFLPPQRLEQSLRTLRASALSRFPTTSSHTEHERQRVGGVQGVTSKKPPRSRTPSETDRIARIFSSRL